MQSRNLPANLFWREGTIWARIKRAGRDYRRCLHTTSVREAERQLAALKQEVDVERERIVTTATFKEAAVEWAATYLKSIKPNAAKRYTVSLRQLDKIFGEVTLAEITPRLIGRFVSARAAQGVSNRTIRNDLSALATIVRVAMSRGWVDSNPVAAWDRRILKAPQKAQRPPSMADLEVVLAHSSSRGQKALLRFLRATGCRLEEATRLRWSEVDMAARTVTILETKTGQPRVIRMTSPGGDAFPILKDVIRHAKCPNVFWRDKGDPYRQASSGLRWHYRQVQEREAAAGREFEPFRTHDLRHAFAIGWLNAGGDIYELSRHLGHTSVKTTEQFYLKWMDPAARDRYERGHQGGTAAAVSVPPSMPRPLISLARRGGRAVDCGGLETRRAPRSRPDQKTFKT